MLKPSASPLSGSGPTNFGGRTYDYTQKYSPDKPGEEAKANARAWHVYIDEAESYDMDMIQGFRSIIDGLLVFASLFAAVVTTFVIQTSQSLQPDNAQIMVSLLFENNQLLRAAGNNTTMNSVPHAALSPGSLTYTLIDLWVNGLFFTSLALSLSTALLTVLAKQWIQAYTSAITGNAKTRALIRHFRFRGLIKWKLKEVIESLPLILHGSVILFLIGLALYVSQLSNPICWSIVSITAVTFSFYFGSSILPAVFIDCPFRIPFIFAMAKLVLFVFRVIKCSLWFLLQALQWKSTKALGILWPSTPQESLKDAEYDAVFSHAALDWRSNVFWDSCQFTCDALDWVLTHSFNRSVMQVVFEAVSGLVDQWLALSHRTHNASILHHNLIPAAVWFFLSDLPQSQPTLTTENELFESAWGRFLENVFETSHRTLLDGSTECTQDWHERVQSKMKTLLLVAITRRDHIFCKYLLRWGQPRILEVRSSDGLPLLHLLAIEGNKENIRYILGKGVDVDQRDGKGETALHYAVQHGNLDTVVALVKRKSTLVPIETKPQYMRTALDTALWHGHSDIVAYLLDQGAERPLEALHDAASSWKPTASLVEVLLDRGWDRALENGDGRTPIDIARRMGNDKIVMLLERYQTAKVRPSNCQ